MDSSQLNCRLLVREARGISLTKEGERLYAHVEVACRHLLHAQEEICGHDAQRYGTVDIGATETALHLYLLDMLHDFKLKYPAIRIKIHNHTTPEILKQLESGKLDFAVITTPFEVPKTLCCEKVLDFRDILVAGVQYKELCKEPLKLQDIVRYPLVGLGSGTATYELYKMFFIEHKIDMELDMEVATSDLILPLVENNFGIGFVAEKMAKPLLKGGKLLRVPVNFEIPGRSIQIVMDQGRGKSLAADTFYKYISFTGNCKERVNALK